MSDAREPSAHVGMPRVLFAAGHPSSSCAKREHPGSKSSSPTAASRASLVIHSGGKRARRSFIAPGTSRLSRPTFPVIGQRRALWTDPTKHGFPDRKAPTEMVFTIHSLLPFRAASHCPADQTRTGRTRQSTNAIPGASSMVSGRRPTVPGASSEYRSTFNA
jgi:hypothetical protein